MTDSEAGTAAESSTASSGGRMPARDEMVANEPLYEVAYDEAKRTIDDQSAELSNVRQRAVQYLAFVGTATAFLAGAVVKSSLGGFAYYTLAICASLLSFASIILVAWMLSPRTTPDWHKRIDSKALVGRWIERQVPAPSRGQMLRDLSLHYDDWRRANEETLTRIRKLYLASIVVGGCQIAVWSLLVWVAARK